LREERSFCWVENSPAPAGLRTVLLLLGWEEGVLLLGWEEGVPPAGFNTGMRI